MSTQTFNQLLGDAILRIIRGLGDPDTTFLIDNTANKRFLDKQNEVADIVDRDNQIDSKRSTSVPTVFQPTDVCLVIASAGAFLTTSEIKRKLEFAGDVRFIVTYQDFFDFDEFDDFELVAQQEIVFTGATRDDNEGTQVVTFQRRKVSV